ncbi:helix-turn-helix domain-containing protein [Saccharococcus sp. Marseille-Q5394]|uniref:helix-turn-helix domain-containing protein n=1 Tax=Saccharococcus sp. Marseille-Q5394 TaxID=2972778 RepID=UPI0021C6CB18|nr:helix-turn-helix domain-containing protein [Saccharococcus sp. Marseille-Q5394]
MIQSELTYSDFIGELIPLIQSNHYDEIKWDALKARLHEDYRDEKLQSHFYALQTLKQKADFLKFSTSTFEILHQINLEVASLAPLTDILNLSATHLLDVSKAHSVLVGMINHEKACMRIEAVAGIGKSDLLFFEESLHSPFQMQLSNNQEPFILADISEHTSLESPLLQNLKEKNIVSLICSPLVAHGERIGIIFLARTVLYHSKLPLLQMLKNFCYQTALSISNAKLYSNEVRVSELHDELFEEALNKGGNEGILQKVANFIEEPILLLDEFGNCIYEAAPRNATYNIDHFNHAELYKCVLQSEYNHQTSFEVIHKNQTFSVFTITLHNRTVAYVIVPKRMNAFDRLSVVAIEQAKNVLALQINQEKTSIEVENRLRQDYLHDLISGLETEENLIRRARYLNISFEKTYAILVMSPIEGEEDHTASLNRVLEKFSYLIDKELLPLSMIQGQKIILVTPEKNIRTVAKFALNYVEDKHPDLQFRIGISNAIVQVKDYLKGFNEAKKAAEFAHSFQFKTPIVHFKELGIIGLLFNTENTEYMKEFMDRYLGKIIKYENQNKSELLKTLEVFLDNESAIQVSAEKLHIHYNTLRYRLNRIEEILEIDLAHTQNRLNLQIAIIIHRLVKHD